jgi:hypothetical protein
MKYKTDLAIAFLLFGTLIMKVSAPGENFAFFIKKFPQYTFVSCYRRKTNVFFVVDTAIYQKIRKLSWTCSNGYIRTTEKKPRYLQRCIYPNVGKDNIIHHESHLFVYCRNKLTPMTRKEHPQKRTYDKDTFVLKPKGLVKFFREIGFRPKPFEEGTKRYKVVK